MNLVGELFTLQWLASFCPSLGRWSTGENVLVKCESSSAMDGSSAELGSWLDRVHALFQLQLRKKAEIGKGSFNEVDRR